MNIDMDSSMCAQGTVTHLSPVLFSLHTITLILHYKIHTVAFNFSLPGRFFLELLGIVGAVLTTGWAPVANQQCLQ